MSSLIASIDRPSGLRLRADLLSSRVESAGATTWIVKDPLTLEHFQFSAEEYALVDWLREPVTIAELQRRFQRTFAPQTITPTVIWEFMSRLHKSGLLMSESVGQGRQLRERRERERMQRWLFSWTGILGIKFPGVDPNDFLNAVRRNCRWLFSPAAAAVALAIVLYALMLVVGHFSEFRERLPELSALVDWRNLPWLLAAIGAVKVLHELAPRAGLQVFRRRGPRTGLHAAGVRTVLVLRCERRLAVPQQVAADRGVGRRRDGGVGARVGRDDRVVVCPAGRSAAGRTERDGDLHAQHAARERQPADAVRRLLHFLRPRGSAELVAAVA